MKKKQVIIIFPEAHIWPYYTGLRNFSSSSFFYPVKMNKPVIALAGTWRAPKKAGKKPKITLHISAPFYPDANLERKEAEQKLRDQVYAFLKDKTSSKDNYEYIKYVKKDKASV
jgi:1-acyl-sn-glycerol-3-phosphate acyltransferase